MTYQELLNFNFEELEPRTNYLRLIGILPKIRKELHPERWRIVEKHNLPHQGIILEITPRWLTVTIHLTARSSVRQTEFNILKKDPKEVILGIFEY